MVQRTQYAERFNRLADLLENRYPAQFTYASGQGPDGSPSIIGFKGSVPDGATELLEGLPFRVTLLGGEPLSAAEILRASRTAIDVLAKSVDAESADADIPRGTTHVNLRYTGGLVDIDEAVIAAIAHAAQASVDSEAALTVTVTRSEAPILTPEVLSGGTALTAPRGGGVKCTAGFPVRNTSGGTGLLTASHCDDDLRYEGRTNLTFTMAGHMDGVGTDAQWFRSDEAVWNKFVYDKVQGFQYLRNVTSVGNTGLTQLVCKYGWYSDLDCGTLLKRDHVVWYNNVGYNVYVLNEYITTGGDSGGPYFLNNSARGIHGGRLDRFEGATRSFYTPIQQVQAKSNLRVYTTP